MLDKELLQCKMSNVIHDYIVWADAKLKEEEERAKKYLETSNECTSMPNSWTFVLRVCVARRSCTNDQ